MKEKKLIEKIVKKNYNNELEAVLETKNFDEYSKNILLSILYKLETAYKDYKIVKADVMPKEQFLQMIIDIIKNDIDDIQMIKMNSEEAKILGKKTFIVDKKNKKIICYPIERKILYAIAKISKNDRIIKDKYYLIDKTISNLLNTGNNINTVEVIRDFNGFSWDIVSKEIESIEYNLIYQNLRILVGADFLNNWIYDKEQIVDYYDLFDTKLKQLYGEKMQNRIIEDINKISILLDMKYDKNKKNRMFKSKEEIEAKLKELSDKEAFIKKVTKIKKNLNKKIRLIDTILNDKDLLKEEYDKRNAQLSKEQKIFSIKVLSNIMKEEREKNIQILKKQNTMLNPQKFVKYVKTLEERYKYLKLVNIADTDINREIEKEILDFQKNFLECFKIKVENAKSREEIKDLIIEYRYYLNIPYTNSKKIINSRTLNKGLDKLAEILILKAIKEKVLFKISIDEELNIKVIKNIFKTKIIDFEGIYLKITKEDEIINLQMFDENVFDQKIEIGTTQEIDIQDFIIKLNKNIKILII